MTIADTHKPTIVEKVHIIKLTPQVRKALKLSEHETPDPRSFEVIHDGWYRNGKPKVRIRFFAREIKSALR